MPFTVTRPGRSYSSNTTPRLQCRNGGLDVRDLQPRIRYLLAHSLVRLHTDTMPTTDSTLHSTPDATSAIVRHLVATLAYRVAKVLRDVPAGFGPASFGAASRRPVQIVAHMADLMTWASTLARGDYVWAAEGGEDWDTEVQRLFAGLATLDRELAAHELPAGSIEKLIQGPLADALTHVGQLAMLRGMAGAPVRPESYARAEITIGRVGLEQAPPVREFDGDASART